MSIDDIEIQVENAVKKSLCEQSHLFFSRYFFKNRQSLKFRTNWHHHYISQALEKIITGEYENLLINIPPGSSKTELAVINFIARGIALNPWARFLHLSSGDDLVLLNSQTARDMVQSDDFQRFWPLKIANDAKAKKRWNVIVDDKTAGGVYAVSLGGQITGFRAGHMSEGFSGAIIIDDPLKADSIFSKVEVARANRLLLSTVTSRKANPKVPIIIIMQRLGEKDPSDFVLNKNLPGNFEKIIIPALIDDEYVSKLPVNIQKLVPKDTPRDAAGRYSYWEYKEPLANLLQLEAGSGTDTEGNRIGRFVFAAQYMQAPVSLGGNIIKSEYFPRVAIMPEIEYRMILADTAQKTAERNDYSVFQCWGKIKGENKIVLLDLIRGKWEAPDLKRRAIEFWNKHKDLPKMGILRKMKVEDKASGTGLIQDIKREGKIPIDAIQRNKDKLTRVMDVVSYIEAGCVVLLEEAPYLSDFISECEAFTSDDTHAHDDQIDPLCDAIDTMLSNRVNSFFVRG